LCNKVHDKAREFLEANYKDAHGVMQGGFLLGGPEPPEVTHAARIMVEAANADINSPSKLPFSTEIALGLRDGGELAGGKMGTAKMSPRNSTTNNLSSSASGAIDISGILTPRNGNPDANEGGALNPDVSPAHSQEGEHHLDKWLSTTPDKQRALDIQKPGFKPYWYEPRKKTDRYAGSPGGSPGGSPSGSKDKNDKNDGSNEDNTNGKNGKTLQRDSTTNWYHPQDAAEAQLKEEEKGPLVPRDKEEMLLSPKALAQKRQKEEDKLIEDEEKAKLQEEYERNLPDPGGIIGMPPMARSPIALPLDVG
jgi:hypothetical protein